MTKFKHKPKRSLFVWS